MRLQHIKVCGGGERAFQITSPHLRYRVMVSTLSGIFHKLYAGRGLGVPWYLSTQIKPKRPLAGRSRLHLLDSKLGYHGASEGRSCVS